MQIASKGLGLSSFVVAGALAALGCSDAGSEYGESTPPGPAPAASGEAAESNTDGTDGYTPPEPVVVEPGKERSALTTLDGFGVDGNSDRCWTAGGTVRWGGSPARCWYPKSRKIYFVRRTDNCTGPYAADYEAALDAAFQYMSSELWLNGWDAQLVLDASSSSNIVSKISCVTPPSGSTAWANTHKTSDGSCSSSTFGQLCKYLKGDIQIYKSNIEGTGEFLRAGQSLRRTFLRNIIAHEMGHVAGLGHDLCGPSPLARLMNNSGCMTTLNPKDADDYKTWTNQSLTTFERDALFNYRP